MRRVVRIGKAFDELIQIADSEHARLIVAGVHRPDRPIERFFLGSTAERILRHGGHPVLLARKVARGPYRRVLVPVDLGDVSLRLLLFVRDPLPSADLTVVHFVPRLRRPGEENRAWREQVSAELKELARAARLDLSRATLEVGEADARAGILSLAETRKADLVAMGTQGRRGIKRVLLGSVAEYVIHGSRGDILAVPPQHT